jgi:hypothetical protein
MKLDDFSIQLVKYCTFRIVYKLPYEMQETQRCYQNINPRVGIKKCRNRILLLLLNLINNFSFSSEVSVNFYFINPFWTYQS